ncbi:DNA polymerase III subunit alpha [Croceicoccus sp. F390]|uniref:DNA polymerase III subunit alpha n=1 Tax=Croceicoccus esteveae TaxID=3075597 RepID=A0ABU2ZFA3_9SPHN|nr:DNA polymerase III subunit alpha [Croceicoccus sp. F390]MDT0574896.1 DNA polymerase III subunit alpha [Croceicoccus sp. F390]
MSFAPFVPLRVFSSYTLLEGAIEPKKIAGLAKERGFPAIAICDRNGLYGAVAFASACVAAGVQPIIGAFLAVQRPEREAIDWIAVYAQDETGWDNLCHLVSRAHLDRPLHLDPHVTFAMLEGHTDGLICLTGAGEGALARLLAEGQHHEALACCDALQRLFPDRLYVEIARSGAPLEAAAEEALIALAYERDLPLVATNPAFFAEADFHEAHDAMLCIANATHVDVEDRPRAPRDAWVKDAAAMQALFADLPEGLANTLVVAQRTAVLPPDRKPILPSLAGDVEGEARLLASDARAGLERRLAQYDTLSDEERQAYQERLQFETEVITGMGFAGYFLIVADFIKWAKENGIPVGPGRGSGAGSVVAWALTITDLDPLRLGLLFERFLNPERVSMPDFDIDFCETRRGEVIRYVQDKYGHDHVAQIITFGKMKARAVLRDCGRILQMSYGHVDRLCKLVPNHPTDPWTLHRTLNGIADFSGEYRRDPQVRRLIDLAMQLEGLPRNSSTHAAGVVIGDRPLSELVPLYRDPRSDMPVTQFDMKHVETSGLIKFDFLGLKTLSVLRKALDLLAQRGITLNLDTLPWDDEAVFTLLQSGSTVGVFQLESEGMRRTLAAVRPTRFEDIIALVSLYRPGPMDNIPLFGRRKNGAEAIEYPHDKLKTVLAETYGIFVYQEQVMQAAQILAGYSLGDADLLRRAMGKKVQSEMDAQRQRFVDGCKVVSDIEASKANELFDLIDKFAGYGFNKSHAAAYALLAYQTAWLKAHYPHEFYAASMCFDMHQSEKLSIFVDDMRRAEVALAAPDINASHAEFTVEPTPDGHQVRYALAGIRNVSEKAMEAVVEERILRGRFTDLANLFRRLPAGSMNRRQLEGLAGAGALDSLEDNRAKIVANADLLLAVADTAAREKGSGQAGLFASEEVDAQHLRLVDAPRWPRAEQMAQERETFGFYFAAHPIEQWRAVASANGARTHASLVGADARNAADRSRAVMAAMIESAGRRRTKRGREYMMLEFSDQTGMFSASCFEEDLIEPLHRWASAGECLLLNVELDRPNPEEPARVTLRGARPIAEVKGTARMVLRMAIASKDALAKLAAVLPRGNGANGEVLVTLHLAEGREAMMRLGRDFALDGDLVDAVAAIDGVSAVTLDATVVRDLRLVA